MSKLRSYHEPRGTATAAMLLVLCGLLVHDTRFAWAVSGNQRRSTVRGGEHD